MGKIIFMHSVTGSAQIGTGTKLDVRHYMMQKYFHACAFVKLLAGKHVIDARPFAMLCCAGLQG